MLPNSGSRQLQDCLVLIVDDQASSRLILTTLLEDMVRCETVTTAQQALAFCRHHNPDLVLMDVIMPDLDGHEACRQLKQQPETSHIPVMFVTAAGDDDAQEACWDAGCEDFVQKPVNATTLRNRVKLQLSHKLKNDLLEQLIYVDKLTGAFNRNYLDAHLPTLVRECNRYDRPLSLAIIDIDYFKQYNDVYGHVNGDKCLRQVSSGLIGSLHRPSDRLVRIGGEEFLVLLPDTPHDGAWDVVSRLRTHIDELDLEHKRSVHKHITISAGVATLTPNASESIDDVIVRADKGLYEAKGQGRNRVISMQVA